MLAELCFLRSWLFSLKFDNQKEEAVLDLK
jgi:hypothetical protein